MRNGPAALAVALAILFIPSSCRKPEPPAVDVGVEKAGSGQTATLAASERAPGHAAPAAPAASASVPTPAAETGLPANPLVVGVDPPNGTTDVDPSRTTLSVTFDRPMDPQGWAWVVEHPVTAPRIGDARWDANHRTSSAQVALEPGHDYVVWVNSPQYSYFRDRTGAAATPFRWTFSTRGERAGPPPGSALPHTGPPRAVSFVPPNGAKNVDPATAELLVTFDRSMGGGWSWVTETAESFPVMTGKGGYEPDGKTAVLPVKLERDRSYVVWLNSPQSQGFRDAAGVPLPPVRWTFTTGGGSGRRP